MTFPAKSRTRFVSRSRAVAAVEIDGRRAWLGLLALARDHAGRALRGEPIDAFEAGELRRALLRLKAPFPIRHVSAVELAAATLALARGFVAAGLPDDRAALARALSEAAAHLESQLVAQGHALAQQSRRWAGDTD